MGFETVGGYVLALSVPVWLVVEQVASWFAGAERRAPAVSGGRRAGTPGRAPGASEVLSGRAA